ncbi:hypothetical protein CRG98_046259 [Punica granatum]|uniref:Uncharacterized protein n=1 Tax=Punica granatum TaxID=22663 RepID=A0A2I0HNP3_PUNGR|nr:hypothetical protein CRG98_046259 [Punica granatum]
MARNIERELRNLAVKDQELQAQAERVVAKFVGLKNLAIAFNLLLWWRNFDLGDLLLQLIEYVQHEFRIDIKSGNLLVGGVQGKRGSCGEHFN